MNGLLHGSRICKRTPSISHLLFVDDSFFFFEAKKDECKLMKEILITYEKVSGQAVNFENSGIFFSSNVQCDDKTMISHLLGVSQPFNTRRYLILPSLIGHMKKSIFYYQKD